MEEISGRGDTYCHLEDLMVRSGLPFTIHEHLPTRTIDEAARTLSFTVERIVKTIAFRTRNQKIVLAALRGIRRVNYPLLAALAGVKRRDIASLSPDDVQSILGVEPGSVSPLMQLEGAELLIDCDVLTITPTLYCGIGRPDRTLELAPSHLVRLTDGRVAPFSTQ